MNFQLMFGSKKMEKLTSFAHPLIELDGGTPLARIISYSAFITQNAQLTLISKPWSTIFFSASMNLKKGRTEGSILSPMW